MLVAWDSRVRQFETGHIRVGHGHSGDPFGQIRDCRKAWAYACAHVCSSDHVPGAGSRARMTGFVFCRTSAVTTAAIDAFLLNALARSGRAHHTCKEDFKLVSQRTRTHLLWEMSSLPSCQC